MYPILLKTPYFTVYSYGFCMAVAVVLAWIISSKLSARRPFSVSIATDLLFVFFVSGIVGARLFYVFQHLADYAGRWQAVFYLQEGGLVWYGGFFGGIACGVVYMKWRRVPVLPWADFFSPILALSQAVGRVGCYLNGCCFGRGGHAVQLYEAVFLAILSAGLFALFFRRKTDGEVFVSYLVSYGLGRFLLEFMRGDQAAYGGLTLPQWVSLGVIVYGAWLYGNIRRSHR